MKKPIMLLVAVILFMGAGFYYTFLSPSAIMKSNTEAALKTFAAAVDSQDRAKVTEMLTALLTDDTKVHLDVAFSAIASSAVRPMSQDFDKAMFIKFIDDVLYTLNDYHMYPLLEDFSVTGDRMANVQFKSMPRANGPSFFSGVTLQVRFSGDVACMGEAVFDEKFQPKFKTANCSILLRSMAKGDSAGDMVNKAQEIHDLNRQEIPQP